MSRSISISKNNEIICIEEGNGVKDVAWRKMKKEGKTSNVIRRLAKRKAVTEII
jgi:hypothetical protein